MINFSWLHKYSKIQLLTVFFLSLMCVQIIAIEGHGTSYIKVMSMLLVALVGFSLAPFISVAVAWGSLYLLSLVISIAFNLESFRLETVLYRFAAVLAFMAFYNLVYCKDIFTLEGFTRLVKAIISTYVIAFVIQQVLKILIFGYTDALIVNLVSLDRSILSANALSLEPSHTARILGGLGIVLLRLYECKYGASKEVALNLWKDFKWGVIGFLWCFISMASGTGMVVIAIILLYFLKRKFAVIGVILILTLNITAPYIEYEPFQRVYRTFNSVSSLDRKTIQNADLSASARVLPYIYTFEHFDLTKRETWIGNGIDTAAKNDRWGTKRMIGDMTDYGFIQYIFALGLIFSCCIRRFLSIETLFFVVVLMAEIRNVYVWWAILMLFASAKYFSQQSDLNMK